MNQEHLKSNLHALERKINILLANHKSIKEQVSDLERKNDELKKDLASKDQQLNDFQNRIKIDKIVDTVGADREYASGLKFKLNDYIKEIDRCIVQLSN